MSKPSPVSETGQRGPLQLAEAAADRIYREDAATWLARVDAASDTLQAAVEQAADTDDSAEPLGRLVAALWPYWRLRGQRDAARHWLTAALDRADAPAVRARLLLGAGVLAFEDSDIRTARVSWAELLGSGKERGDPDAEALGLAGLSLVAHRLGDPLRADVLGRSSLARSEAGAGPFAGILARLVRGRVLLS
ncbi:MAG: hypothetical protein IT199_06770, partial [Solirubrobacterales bacterium]|nr:hypothetical protein [Solirubrobacterales bacterium]